MKLDQFTHASQELIQKAAVLAQEKQNPILTPLHLLAASINEDFCRSFFFSLGINLDQLKTIVNTEIDRLPRATGSQLAVDQAFEQFISACQKQAQELGDTYVSLESFLLQFATSNFLPPSIRDFFAQNRFTKQRILEHMQEIRKGKR